MATIIDAPLQTLTPSDSANATSQVITNALTPNDSDTALCTNPVENILGGVSGASASFVWAHPYIISLSTGT